MLHCGLSILARGSEIFMTRCLADFGLTATEIVLLRYLYDAVSPAQDDISEHFMLDRGSIARTLRKLEDKDIIRRHENPNNHREKIIILTDKGLELKSFCVGLTDLWQNIMLSGISEDDASFFESILNRMVNNVAKSLNEWESEKLST